MFLRSKQGRFCSICMIKSCLDMIFCLPFLSCFVFQCRRLCMPNQVTPVTENLHRVFSSQQPHWCPKTTMWPCWFSKPVLWELNSFLMLTLPFFPFNLHSIATWLIEGNGYETRQSSLLPCFCSLFWP